MRVLEFLDQLRAVVYASLCGIYELGCRVQVLVSQYILENSVNPKYSLESLHSEICSVVTELRQ